MTWKLASGELRILLRLPPKKAPTAIPSERCDLCRAINVAFAGN